MPLYEYRCLTCGKTFEVIQKFSDAPVTVHEGCGGAVERLVSTSSFQLKGSGWYATDYAKSAAPKPDGKAGEAKSEAQGDAKSAAKSDSKADGKPAASEAKPESKAESKPAASTKTDK